MIYFLLSLFLIVSLVPFHSLLHIKILNFPVHYFIITFGTVILFISTVIKTEKRIRDFDKWLILLCVALFSSLITSVDKSLTLKTVGSFIIRGVVISFVASKIVNVETRKNLLSIVLVSVASIVCLLGLFEVVFDRILFFHKLYLEYNVNYKLVHSWGRGGMTSTIGHPLPLAAYLVLLLPISIWFLQEKKSIISAIPSFLILSTIFLSLTRSAWISSAVVLFFYFLRKENRLFIKRLRLVLVCIIFFNLLFFLSPKTSKTFLSRLHIGTSQSHRVASYVTIWNIFKEYPLFGVGMGNYPKVHRKYKAKDADLESGTPDNMYLRILCETGIIGTLTFFAFIFNWMFKLWKYKDDGFSWAIFVGLAGFLMNLIAGDLFYWLAPQFTFWFLLGLGINYGYRKENR